MLTLGLITLVVAATLVVVIASSARIWLRPADKPEKVVDTTANSEGGMRRVELDLGGRVPAQRRRPCGRHGGEGEGGDCGNCEHKHEHHEHGEGCSKH